MSGGVKVRDVTLRCLRCSENGGTRTQERGAQSQESISSLLCVQTLDVACRLLFWDDSY